MDTRTRSRVREFMEEVLLTFELQFPEHHDEDPEGVIDLVFRRG